MADAQRQVEDHPRDERQDTAHEPDVGQVPAREDQADGHREGALEDHRAGDVAQGERVLALPDPEHGVELLRQLGGDGSDEQRDEQRVGPERLAEHLRPAPRTPRRR